jgi:hypothetical protein
MANKRIRFGFINDNQQLTDSVGEGTADNTEIVGKLLRIQMLATERVFNHKTREFAKLIQGKPVRGRFRSLITCQLCKQCSSDVTFKIQLGDKEYWWPSELSHYLSQHRIEPPKELLEMLEKIEK